MTATNYTYDTAKKILYIDHQIPAEEAEETEVGTCSDCRSPIISQSYHLIHNDSVVIGKCIKCGKLSANIYDKDWNWISEIPNTQFLEHDHELAINASPGVLNNKDQDRSDIELLNSIPENKLESIFSSTEIIAMFSRARGENCTRQYLYNARKKYQKFEDVFGIKIDI